MKEHGAFVLPSPTVTAVEEARYVSSLRLTVAVGATAPCYKEARLVNLPKAGVEWVTTWLTVNAQVGEMRVR